MKCQTYLPALSAKTFSVLYVPYVSKILLAIRAVNALNAKNVGVPYVPYVREVLKKLTFQTWLYPKQTEVP